MTDPESIDNNNLTLANCLRSHRRRVGLSQEELGRLLGYHDETAVAKHERFKTMPPFLTALGYEVIFGVSVSALFPGITQTIALESTHGLPNLNASCATASKRVCPQL